jgi:hypothetical protein
VRSAGTTKPAAAHLVKVAVLMPSSRPASPVVTYLLMPEA